MAAAAIELMARTVRGIEWIAAAEIAATLAPTDVALGHRQVTCRVPALTSALLGLGTVDDVFLVLLTIDGIGPQRSDLAKLGDRARQLDAAEIVSVLQPLREVEQPVAFDVVASFLGRRNFNRFEVEDVFGSALAAVTGWTHHSRSAGKKPPPTALTFRIHIADESAVVGARLGTEPLHRRRYKHSSRIGTLHPPLARAMVLLAGMREGVLMVDPFCGAGTIVVEAALVASGVRALGFDIDPAAVAAASENASSAGVAVEFRVADAASLSLDGGAADRVVSNPPWGRALESVGSLRPFWVETARILAPDGRCVVLATREAIDAAEAAGLRVVLRNHIRLFGAQVELAVVCPGDGEEKPIDVLAPFGAELARWWEAGVTP